MARSPILRSTTNAIGAADVLADYESYHLIEFWGVDDWNTYGQITGSYQVTPPSEGNTGDLTLETLGVLDPDGTNVVYCWTGQTASMLAAWLSVLGYDARSLLFSSNAMIYDDLQGHKWTSSTSLDLMYETGE